MKISRRSWHYRFARFMWNWPFYEPYVELPPMGACYYFWMIVGYMFIKLPIAMPMGYAMVGVLVVLLYPIVLIDDFLNGLRKPKLPKICPPIEFED
jgi:hypothetical protein